MSPIRVKFGVYFPTPIKNRIALLLSALIHANSLLPHILLQVNQTALALHLAISNLNDLLSDFATTFAISLLFKISVTNNPRCIYKEVQCLTENACILFGNFESLILEDTFICIMSNEEIQPFFSKNFI